MDWFFTSPFGSIIVFLSTYKPLFVIAIFALIGFFNFVFWPKWKKFKELEKLYEEKLSQLPNSGELFNKIQSERKELIEEVRNVINNHNTQSTLYMEKLYTYISNYENELNNIIKNLNNISSNFERKVDDIERDINALIRIREEMINLIENIIGELERKNIIDRIDRTPILKIRQLMKFTDKYFLMLLKEQGMKFEQTERSGLFSKLYDEETEVTEDKKNEQ